jgi:hypothetical protein
VTIANAPAIHPNSSGHALPSPLRRPDITHHSERIGGQGSLWLNVSRHLMSLTFGRMLCFDRWAGGNEYEAALNGK